MNISLGAASCEGGSLLFFAAHSWHPVLGQLAFVVRKCHD